MSSPPRSLSVLAVIAAAILWGSTGTVQALLPAERAPLVVGALRLAIGALALLALAAATAESRAGFCRLPRGPVLAAAVFIAGYNLLFFAGVAGAGVGTGTAITIGGAPIWVTAYELLAERRLPQGRRLFGQAISIAGAVLLVVSGQNGEATPTGLICAALAGACYAGYSLATSRAAGAAPPATTASATFALAALLACPALLIFPVGWLAAPQALALMAFLGIVSTGLAYAFYTWGLRGLRTSTAVTLALAEPLTAWLLATFLLNESVSATKLAGAVMLMAGLAIVTLSPAPDRSA